MFRACKQKIIVTAIAYAGTALVCFETQGATYSMVFNNVEQGANSQANPVLNVGADGKVDKTQVNKTDGTQATAQTVEKTAAPLPSSTSPDKPSIFSQGHVDDAGVETSRAWRASLVGIGVNDDWQGTTHDHSITRYGLGGELAYFPLEDLGFNIFGSGARDHHWYYGGEVEFTPLRVTSFGWKDWLQVGFLLGASNMAADKKISLDPGLRLTLALGDRYGITTAVRSNVFDRGRYAQLETGLTVRF